MDAGDFPMAGRAVFARRCRAHASPRTGGVSAPLKTFDRLDIPEAQALQPGQLQSPADAGDVAECIATLVSVSRGIRSGANSDAIEDNDCGALQLPAPVYDRSTRERNPVSSS